jgi:hypothetical protein
MMKILKATYFATICLPPPLLLFVYPMVFVWHVRFPNALIHYYPFYFWIGLILLIVDLWRSNYTQRTKVVWTALNVLLGIIFLPIYWGRYIVAQKSA